MFKNRLRHVFVLLTPLVLALGVACSSNPASPTPAPTSIPPTVPMTPTNTMPVPTNTIALPTLTPAPAGTPTLPSVSPLVFVFQITGDANDPLASPNAFAFDKQGNIYVADASNRRILKFDSAGKLLAKWGSSGNGEGQFFFSHVPGGMAIDDQGNVYVVDDGNTRIEKFDGNGKFLTQWGSKGAGEGQFTTPQNVVVDAQGNVYVLDFYNENVQKFDSNGKFLSKLGGYGAADGQFSFAAGLALDGQGNIYVGDASGFFQKFDKDAKFVARFTVTNCPWIDGITVDDQGNVYAFQHTDDINKQPSICKFDSAGKTVAKWNNFGSDNGQWKTLSDIHIDAQGYIYIADRGNNRIEKLQQPSSTQALFIATALPSQPSPVAFVWKIMGDPEPFNSPTGLTLDSQGNLYVFDVGSSRVLKYNADGKFLTQWGSQGSGDGQFGLVLPHSVSIPDLTVDGQGNIYVADFGNTRESVNPNNARVQKFDANGKFLLAWGTAGNDAGPIRPIGMALDSQGNIYISDDQNYRIEKFDSTGKFLTKFGSSGSGDGQFLQPRHIAIDDQGNIYVADFGNDRVQKLDRNGKFLAKWNSCGEYPLTGPVGLALDAQGNLYVSIYGAFSLPANPSITQLGNRICKFDYAGHFQFEWGSKGAGDGQFNSPVAIAVDNTGNVYVSDMNNHRIQKFSQK